MTIMRKAIWGLGIVLLACAGLAAWHLWPAFYPPEHIEVGTSVGDQVPIRQALKNAQGETVTLESISGASGTVLVMVRSADWCPFCKVQLADHADIGEELAAKGYTLASLSYDEPEKLAEFSEGLERPFVMLSDTESAFIDAVGLRDPQYGEDHFAHGVPRASVLVLAPDGTIKNKLVSADYRQRPSNDFVLGMIVESIQ